jgi:hypothetical protein
MEPLDTPLRYRFDDLEQARAHVVREKGRALFFFRHERLSLVPGSSLQMEWTFRNAEPARMLHGIALETVDRCGVWMELLDTRPLHELAALHTVRQHRRMATDRPIVVVKNGRPRRGRLLDISAGGARIAGISGAAPGDRVELRAPSFEDPTRIDDLGGAFIVWAESGEMGVQFDRLESASRSSVIALVADVAASWASALESRHPAWCCRDAGPIEVPLPGTMLPTQPAHATAPRAAAR